MYVNRETGLLRDSLSDHDLTTTETTVRETRSGQGVGVAMVARPRRQRSGVANRNTVDDVQQQASQRRNSSGPYGKKRPRWDTVTRGSDTSKTSVRQLLRRTLDSTATPVDGSTTARPAQKLVRHTPSDSHSDNFKVDYCDYCRSPRNALSSATGAQFQLHCVSVINVNRLTELLRRTFTTPLSQVYLYTQWLSRVKSHLILTRRHLAHAGTGTSARAPYSHKIICHRPRHYTTPRNKEHPLWLRCRHAEQHAVDTWPKFNRCTWRWSTGRPIDKRARPVTMARQSVPCTSSRDR